jgi:hypothetical protein
MKEQATKAARVSAGGIGEIARQGVERALAARGAVVLSDEQAGQVGGGATLSPALKIPIIAGGRPIDIFGTRLGGEVFNPTTLGGAAGALTLGV